MAFKLVGLYCDINPCPRCDEEHDQLELKALTPMADSTTEAYPVEFFGTCPVTGRSLLTRVEILREGAYELEFDLSQPS